MNHYFKSVNSNIQTNLKNWMNKVSEEQGDETFSFGNAKKSLALKLVSKMVGLSIPFATRNGFKVIDFKPGYVKALIPLKPNRNHLNTMYAGALFTVAELPGGIISLLSFDDSFYPILKELKMDFLKVAKSDVTVEFEISKKELLKIEAETLEVGKSNFVLRGEIKDMSGLIVATSFASYQLRTH